MALHAFWNQHSTRGISASPAPSTGGVTVKSIHDDKLVIGEGKTLAEAQVNHDRNFIQLMDRCREKQLKLNKDEMKFQLSEVKFIGHTITAEGLKPDPEKLKAVLDMPNPTDVAGVRRFIGFVTYLA